MDQIVTLSPSMMTRTIVCSLEFDCHLTSWQQHLRHACHMWFLHHHWIRHLVFRLYQRNYYLSCPMWIFGHCWIRQWYFGVIDNASSSSNLLLRSNLSTTTLAPPLPHVVFFPSLDPTFGIPALLTPIPQMLHVVSSPSLDLTMVFRRY